MWIVWYKTLDIWYTEIAYELQLKMVSKIAIFRIATWCPKKSPFKDF